VLKKITGEKDFTANANILMGNDYLEVRKLEILGGKSIEILLKSRRRATDRVAVLYASYGVLSVGLERIDNKMDPKITARKVVLELSLLRQRVGRDRQERAAKAAKEDAERRRKRARRPRRPPSREAGKERPKDAEKAAKKEEDRKKKEAKDAKKSRPRRAEKPTRNQEERRARRAQPTSGERSEER
jgi:hypothetical protein